MLLDMIHDITLKNKLRDAKTHGTNMSATHDRFNPYGCTTLSPYDLDLLYPANLKLSRHIYDTERKSLPTASTIFASYLASRDEYQMSVLASRLLQ